MAPSNELEGRKKKNLQSRDRRCWKQIRIRSPALACRGKLGGFTNTFPSLFHAPSQQGTTRTCFRTNNKIRVACGFTEKGKEQRRVQGVTCEKYKEKYAYLES
jgi:hypothetical protein